MSYIRPLSNPESMYAYSSIVGLPILLGGHTEIHLDLEEEQRFIKFLRLWRSGFEDDLDDGEFCIKEQNRSSDFKYFIKIKGKEIELWYVTLFYFVHNILSCRPN